MNLEEMVCSLEYAKKLKDLGIKQEGFYCWARQDGFKNWGLELYPPARIFKRMGRTYYLAFTSGELGEILPKLISTKNGIYNMKLGWEHFANEDKILWRIDYIKNNGFDEPLVLIDDENESNARAKMIIYLIENKIWIPK